MSNAILPARSASGPAPPVPALPTALIPLIDCDIHPGASKHPIEPFIPAAFREAMKQAMGGQPGQGYANPFGVIRRDAKCDDPHDVVRDHFDRYGIAYGVLQPPGLAASVTHNIDVGTAKARAWNDWQAEIWLAADKRYLGSVCVNMNDPEGAAQEIRRMGSHPQMVQVIVSGEARDLYGHRRYFPIYEACQEMGLAFALHPGNEGSYNSATPIGRPSSYFEWHTVIPLTFQAHLVSMVTEGVFEKYSGLKLVLVEGGIAWLAHTMWRMDKNFKALRSTTPWLHRLPSEYVYDHVRLTTQPLEEPDNPEHLLQMFNMVHAERTVCFASDFPHWDFDDPRRVFPRAMSEKLKRRVFYENAAEIYGLPPLAQAQSQLTAQEATP
jgi:predicted TIM-barrel fold metal-dependent hydrolase